MAFYSDKQRKKVMAILNNGTQKLKEKRSAYYEGLTKHEQKRMKRLLKDPRNIRLLYKRDFWSLTATNPKGKKVKVYAYFPEDAKSLMNTWKKRGYTGISGVKTKTIPQDYVRSGNYFIPKDTSISTLTISKKLKIHILSTKEYYDEYSKRRRTIIPSKAFYDHKKHEIFVDKGAITSKKDLEHTIKHELGHHKLGYSEELAEKYTQK